MAAYEPLLARTLSDSLLAGWLLGARDAADRVPPEKREQATAPEIAGGFLPPTILPPPLTFPEPEEGEPSPVVHFPQIEAAAQDLASRRLLTQDEYNLLDAQARETAFTVARVASLDALEKIRDALVVDIAEGGTLRAFAERVDGILGESALSPAHVENVYRTNVAQAYSAAQKDILNHPLIGDEFPYVEYHAVHDSRTEEEHLALETLGIQGTNIYRRDDPVIQLFWPPWRWNCRCMVIPLTLEMAAAKGIKEAVRWLATGVPPANPAYVPMPNFRPPPGWDRGTVQLGLSV